MANCTNCGQEIGESAFCPNCGAPQNAQDGPGAAGQAAQAGPTYVDAQPANAGQPYGQAYDQQAGRPYGQSYDPQAGQPGAQVYGAAPQDAGSFGWSVLGFFFPLVGLILFLVWKDSKPVSAKQAGVGALVGVILSFVLYMLFACVGMAASGIYDLS